MKGNYFLPSLKKLALGLFLMQGVSFHLLAQSLDSVQDLSGVTISAAPRPRIKANIGQLQALNINSLERLNAIQLSDAVKYFAGATVKDYGGIGGLKTVSVRGFSASHTGVLIDLIPTSNATNGQIDLSKYTLDNVNEIRLSNDNYSTNLQTASYYAKSTQLSLMESAPTFVLNGQTQVELSLKTGSFGLFNPQLGLYQRVGNKHLVSLNADYQKSKGDYGFKLVNGQITTTETRSNSEVEIYRLNLKWQSFGAAKHRYFIKANYYDSYRQLPGAVILYNVIPNNQELKDKEFAVQGQYSYQFQDSTHILFNAKVSDQDNRYVDYNFNAVRPLDNQFSQIEWFGSGAIQSRRIYGFKGSLSSDIVYNKIGSNLRQYAYPTRLTSLTNLALNYKWRSLLLYGNILQTATFEEAKATAVAINRQKLSPTFGANYQHHKRPYFSARAFFKQTYRIPTFNELYYTNNGNTKLLPELTHQWNMGFTYEHAMQEKSYFVVSVDGYFNKVSDKIVAIPTHIFEWTMTNIGQVDVLGLDVVCKAGIDINKQWDVFGEINYSLQNAIDVSRPTATNFNHQIPYTPKHSGSVIVGTNTWLTVQYGLLFSGERYKLSTNSATNRLEPYFDHSISFSKNIPIQHLHIRVAFEVLNFTNKNYDVVAYYPMPGRHYRLTFKARLASIKMDANRRKNRASERLSND
ncbi:MAG: TonB-dependent receptor plug domain-containing protein [Bacteroidales bacterium]|nr:TonB-dependent receptor plug domain-containing protein [Bacteroidales bacterium]